MVDQHPPPSSCRVVPGARRSGRTPASRLAAALLAGGEQPRPGSRDLIAETGRSHGPGLGIGRADETAPAYADSERAGAPRPVATTNTASAIPAIAAAHTNIGR
jgi:hypothetical protein